jgi:hypothetical protein
VTTPPGPTPRQRLLDAAGELFYRQGIGAVGVDLVSKQAFARHAERGQAKDPQRLADQLIVVFDGAIVQAVIGTLRHSDAARTAAQALLDAHGIP